MSGFGLEEQIWAAMQDDRDYYLDNLIVRVCQRNPQIQKLQVSAAVLDLVARGILEFSGTYMVRRAKRLSRESELELARKQINQGILGFVDRVRKSPLAEFLNEVEVARWLGEHGIIERKGR